MRIIGGKWRGKKLVCPPGNGTRPTTDAWRERMFNILTARQDPPLVGATVLDLFAGTGALALEAISRGAAKAMLVEQDPAALATIRTNIATCGAGDQAQVENGDALNLRPAHEPVDLIFADPPYSKGLTEPVLARLAAGGWLRPGTLLVAEMAAKDQVDWLENWHVLKVVKQRHTQTAYVMHTKR